MADIKRRVGVFLIAKRIPPDLEGGCIFPPQGMAAFESTFSGAVSEGLAAAETARLQAYIRVSLGTNLLISTRDLVKMEVVVDGEEREPIECHYFLLPEVDPSQLLIDPSRKEVTFRGRPNMKNFMLMSLNDAMLAPMDPVTERMLKRLSVMETPQSNVDYSYTVRPGLGFSNPPHNSLFELVT